MNILIVTATHFEIKPLSEKLGLTGKPADGLTHCRFRGNQIDILVTGVGMMATAFHLGRHLLSNKYDIAINAGICGSFVTTTGIGDVVEVTEEYISDLGAEDTDRFVDVFDLGLCDPDTPPFNNGKLINRSGFISHVLARLTKVQGTTVNKVPGTTRNTRSIYSPVTESMEGAAFFYSCLMEGIPFAQIRAVSNFVEEQDKTRWNVRLAVTNLNDVLMEIIEGLKD